MKRVFGVVDLTADVLEDPLDRVVHFVHERAEMFVDLLDSGLRHDLVIGGVSFVLLPEQPGLKGFDFRGRLKLELQHRRLHLHVDNALVVVVKLNGHEFTETLGWPAKFVGLCLNSSIL